MRIGIFHWDIRATKASLDCKYEIFFLQNPYKTFNQSQTFDWIHQSWKNNDYNNPQVWQQHFNLKTNKSFQMSIALHGKRK